MPARRARSSAAVLGIELGERVPDDPGAVAVVVAGGAFRLVAEGLFGRGAIDDGERPVGPREGLLDVRLRVAHEVGQQRQGVDGDLRVAAASPVDVGHRRDRRADEAALPARRAVDEQLQLGPSVGLGGDALGVRVRERVDRDPVAGFASGAAEELPGPLGLDVERPLEEAEGEPARLELRLVEEPVGDEEERRRAHAAGRVAEAALDGSHQRPADAVDRADARARPAAGRRGTPGSARRCEPLRQGRGEAVRVVGELGQGRAERLGGVAVGGHERDGVGRGLAANRGRRSRVAVHRSGGPGSTVTAAPVSGVSVGRYA